jgi:hypothetical protein
MTGMRLLSRAGDCSEPMLHGNPAQLSVPAVSKTPPPTISKKPLPKEILAKQSKKLRSH